MLDAGREPSLLAIVCVLTTLAMGLLVMLAVESVLGVDVMATPVEVRRMMPLLFLAGAIFGAVSARWVWPAADADAGEG